MNNIFHSTKIQVLLIILATALAYGNIFQNGLVWDDHKLIENWTAIQSVANLPQFLTHPMHPDFPGTYRPFRFVFGTFLYTILHTNPFGYHVVTLLIHLTVTLLVYALMFKLTTNPIIPYVTALLFGVHPIHTEAITWTSSGLDMMGVVLMLSSLVLLISDHVISSKRKAFSLMLSVLAYFSLEITIVLPVLTLLVILFRHQKRKMTPPIHVVIVQIAGVLGYLLLRWKLGNVNQIFGYADDNYWLTTLLTTHVLTRYIGLLIVPVSLTINHIIAPNIPSFMVEIGPAFPRVLTAVRAQSLMQPSVLLAAGIIISAIFVGFATVRKQSLFSFSIAWFFITLLPVLNIVPSHTLMAERYLYLPSIGFCMFISLILSKMLYHTSPRFIRVLGTLLLCSIILWYSGLTIQRNSEWKSDLSLWTVSAARNPFSFIAYAALGKAYIARNDIPNAIRAYKHILETYPGNKAALVSLTELYLQDHEYSKALSLVQSALVITPNDSDGWIKLGDIYMSLRRTSDAHGAYKNAIQTNPNNSRAINRLQEIKN